VKRKDIWTPDRGHDDVAMFELCDWEKLPYALVWVVDGFVVLDRNYRLVCAGERYLSDWRPEDGRVQFAMDPRLVPGLFTLVVDNTGWLYNSQRDSSVGYKERLERLIALREGRLGRC
jgi:hypothetical protein